MTPQCVAAGLTATTWGRGSDGRAPRLHRGGAGSTPAVSIVGAAARRTPSHRFAFLLGDECGLCLLGLMSLADAGRAAIGGGQAMFTPLWCQGQHAPFVRLRCRFDSCRRLFYADVVSIGRAPGRQPGGARSIRAVRFLTQARGVTASITSSNLVGPGSNPGGPAFSVARSSRAGAARFSHGRRPQGLRFESASRPHPTTATKHTFCCGPKQVRLSTPDRQVAGSNPARSFSVLR